MRVTSSRWLEANWDRARIEGIAMMTYNPSIGRVLAPGGVQRFKAVAWGAIRGLSRIRNQQAFDRFHHRLVVQTLRAIPRTSKRRHLSYGQAQKPINVFLKVFVDWAKLPDRRTAARLGQFLHVPLDSIVMDRVRREHRRLHDEIVAPAYRGEEQWPSDLSLSTITRRMYLAWQRFFRAVRPHRPIDLDVIWSRAPRE